MIISSMLEKEVVEDVEDTLERDQSGRCKKRSIGKYDIGDIVHDTDRIQIISDELQHRMPRT